MEIGVGIGPVQGRCEGFGPELLFSGATRGTLIDPSRGGDLRQDSAATLAVSAPGQAVGHVRDRSGQGRNATQATAGQRPVWGRVPAGGRRNLLPYSEDFTQWSTLRNGTGVTPTLNRLPLLSSQNLPDGWGGDAGQGFTCTGLALAGSDLWVGNLGLPGPGASGAMPALVKLSPDRTGIAAQIAITENPQGVAFDGTHLYYAGPTGVWRIAPDGSGETRVLTLASANALVFDPDRQGFWVSQFLTSAISFHRASDWSLVTSFDTGVMLDHTALDPATGWLLISSGNNNVEGKIGVYDPVQQTLLKQYTVAEGYAIEGLAVVDGEIVAALDGYYHRSEIPAAFQLNRLVTVRIKARPDGRPADLWHFDGGGLPGSNDFSGIQSANPGVSLPSLTVSALVAAYDETAPVIGIRQANVGYSWPVLGTSWQTISKSGSGSPGAAALQLLARKPVGESGSSDVISFWLAGGQYESGTTPTGYQTVAGAFDVSEHGARSLAYLGHDLIDDALSVTLPDFGTDATEFWASAADGTVINGGVTVGAGARVLPQRARLHAYGIVDRALTASETAALTAWLDRSRGG